MQRLNSNNFSTTDYLYDYTITTGNLSNNLNNETPINHESPINIINIIINNVKNLPYYDNYYDNYYNVPAACANCSNYLNSVRLGTMLICNCTLGSQPIIC